MSKHKTRRLLTEGEAAAHVEMSEAFLRALRSRGAPRGRTPKIPYLKIGRSVRYLPEDLDRWLIACRIDERANVKGSDSRRSAA